MLVLYGEFDVRAYTSAEFMTFSKSFLEGQV